MKELKTYLPSLEGKNIVLIVTGSVAVYKAIELLRLYQHMGAKVRVIMSQGACLFIQPLLFKSFGVETMSSFEEDIDNQSLTMRHIEWAKKADVVCVAPASASFIAKMRAGMANEPSLAMLLATKAPIILAPAMNTNMYTHPATLENLQTLQKRGVFVFPTEEGLLACQETGLGRMSNPFWLALETEFFAQNNQKISKEAKGLNVLLTLGGTEEKIDDIRTIGNQSSGLMGYALARAFSRLGANVHCIQGSTQIPPLPGVKITHANTAKSMLDALKAHFKTNDIIASVAAIGDLSPQKQQGKIAKADLLSSLSFSLNPDLIGTIKKIKGEKEKPYLLGFAAQIETSLEKMLEKAKEKRKKKGLDAIVANRIDPKEGFGTPNNTLHLLNDSKEPITFKGSKFFTSHQLASCVLNQVK